MLQAVLDTNIWLATHVVAITTGYSAMFLAGMLAIIYVIRGVFTRSLKKETADSLARMTYGVVCFATLFSFVGTVLGGIWADQSWGRFWGWDPKENGAVLIVLWCAIILHARWGGFIRQRGLMIMSIFGNVVTSFSWFGVNMLGVGLHSYGFMQKAFPWLCGFILSQLALMAIAAMPLERWRSFRTSAVAIRQKSDTPELKFVPPRLAVEGRPE
jgi:cytochrome c biogenesis factor